MHLYDQLRKLQQLEKAFDDWTTYRGQLTSHITQQLRPNHKVAIIGAGRCNDINLSHIAAHVQSITLIDKDYESMKEALQRYHLAESSNLILLEKDLVGISDAAYRYYADQLIAEVRKGGYQTDCSQLAQLALSLMHELVGTTATHQIDLGRDAFDTIVAVGVHSQLLSMIEWIWSIILQTIKKNELTVREEIIGFNSHFIKKVNDAMIASAKKQLIIGCEKERSGRVGSIQGAIQCFDDMESRCTEQILLVNRLYLEWPFNPTQNIAYTMQIDTYQKDA